MAIPPDLLKRAERVSQQLAEVGTELTLAGAGMAPPPFGTAADVVSLGRDTWKALSGTGSWWDVAFSAAGFIPIAGDGAKAGKVISKLDGLAKEAAEVASDLSKYGDEASEALGGLGDALGGLKKAGCDTLGIKQICATLNKIDEAKAGGKGKSGGGGGGGGKGSGNSGGGGSEGKTPRAARREAMRKQGIPTSQQPVSQSKNASGREYTYQVPKQGGGTKTMSVQQQTLDRSHPGQGHFEAGPVKVDPLTGEIRRNRHGRPQLQNSKSKVDYDD